MRNESFTEIINNLKHELAVSKLEHLSSIIEYKYGFENSPCYHRENEDYMIKIDDAYWELSDTCNMDIHRFEKEKLIKMNVHFMAHNLVKKVWSKIPQI